MKCTKTQRQLLIERLKKGACTTIQARHELDILAVAPRVHELRKIGFNIRTFWVYDINPGGGEHKIASYSLLPNRE